MSHNTHSDESAKYTGESMNCVTPRNVELPAQSTKRPYRLVLLAPAVIVLGISCSPDGPDISPGVSWDLAAFRAKTISNVHYSLQFSIPSSIDERIGGTAVIRLSLSDARHPLVFDFVAPPEDVLDVRASAGQVDYEVRDEHLVIPAASLKEGVNQIEIEFLAGDLSLNRNPEFLYTLFVPDRARTSFPCFDQPNLKAIYALSLETPASWRAVANGPLTATDTVADRVVHRFVDTQPLSTYLFSFAAGEFQVESAERDGRLIRMYHRETEREKVARNREAVFDLHGAALAWLEEYTGLPYPFDKFDFVLVPSFQYGGMEHAGAILYRASRLLLDETATQSARLGRASLIAHETAHMWFGDLVTMNWFDDVWTKEVFANFMAAKIVNPSFPDINHQHRFFFSHYPSAYAIDRTKGANPIRQPLENLNEAGTLYGAIIYQKAPVVMRQLERMIGERTFQDGIREYVSAFAYANATWPDLIEILDGRSDEDLTGWSQVWVDEPDRPTVSTAMIVDADGTLDALEMSQSDMCGGGRSWVQHLEVTLGWQDSITSVPVYLNSGSVRVDVSQGTPVPSYVLSAGEGLGYGMFQLDDVSRDYLVEYLPEISDPVTRGVAWVTLWDAVLAGEVEPHDFVDLIMRALPREDVELNMQRILGYLNTAYWRLLDPTDRLTVAPDVERLLWTLLSQSETTSRKAAYFSSYSSLALTEEGSGRLLQLWQRRSQIAGLPLFERDYIRLAQNLALREATRYQEILDAQLERIENPDRRASFEFVIPALSADQAVRDQFFESLADPANREHEPWVLTGVAFLHHPLRAASAERYILPSLELLEEIQRTGDIFFPKRWLDSTLGGHSSPTAAAAVRDFLSGRQDYPPRLRLKIEQSADLLFRAAEILQGL
jgi:aminopeptidase N